MPHGLTGNTSHRYSIFGHVPRSPLSLSHESFLPFFQLTVRQRRLLQNDENQFAVSFLFSLLLALTPDACQPRGNKGVLVLMEYAPRHCLRVPRDAVRHSRLRVSLCLSKPSSLLPSPSVAILSSSSFPATALAHSNPVQPSHGPYISRRVHNLRPPSSFHPRRS